MTQNPYNQGNIKNWELLHNNGENITVGVFGSIYDKDADAKIKQLKDLRDKCKYIKEEYAAYNGSYYYAIASARKVRIKTRVR